ncbi:bifunctional precorrin-2 dehydrogenase/sirohydrochlorin ferrochelatase [uncultured Trichococcus sp.]|uniref:precorrin-2 dehydrogenase/sirohydrochlorin ferrochelatase family protein n=1 Tax=uncultured Trichococcus sp. TaxID=189665 RepID=UPI002A18B994|nr:bifunctional precorrin-2 dehydrogenase/sirohydrochlorin ferrochelatase [uncultured Trichococcus sp.]
MYPMMVDISKRKVVVVGGGKIATRKLRELIRCGAQPTVVAPAVSQEIQEWAEGGKALLVRRIYQSGDLDDATFVFICTDDPATNKAARSEVGPYQFMNDTTDCSNSDFINLATLRQQEYLVAVSTYGNDPRKAKQILNEIAEKINPTQA